MFAIINLISVSEKFAGVVNCFGNVLAHRAHLEPTAQFHMNAIRS